MKADAVAVAPTVGDDAQSLGVRVLGDIVPDKSGAVHPGPHGMSVAPSLRALPLHRIPKRLRPIVPAARGSDHLHIWTIGTEAFASGPACTGLHLTVDNDHHGTVGPDAAIALAGFRAALAATQHGWSIEEVA